MGNVVDGIFVFVTTDTDMKERVVIIYDEVKRMIQPMIVLADDLDTLNRYKEEIKLTAKKHNIVVELLKFTTRETVEVIGEGNLLS
jgi:hypothetical protein